MANVNDNIVEFWGMSEASGNRVGTKGVHDLTPSTAMGNVTGLIGNAWDRPNTHNWMAVPTAAVTGLLTADEIAVTMFIYPTAGSSPIAFGFGTSTTNRFEGGWRNSTTDNTCTLGAQAGGNTNNITATFGPALNEWCMMTWWSFGFQQGIVMFSASRGIAYTSTRGAYRTSQINQSGINTRIGAPVSGTGTWSGRVDQTILWSKTPDLATLAWLWNRGVGRTEATVNTGATVFTNIPESIRAVQTAKVIEPIISRDTSPILATGQAWPLHQ